MSINFNIGSIEHSNIINIMKTSYVSNFIKEHINLTSLNLQFSDICFSSCKYLEIIKRLSSIGKCFVSRNDCIFVFSEFNEFVIMLNLFSKGNLFKILYTIYTNSIEIINNLNTKIINELHDTNVSLDIDVKWYYWEQGLSDYESIPMKLDDIVYDEAYPYIEGGIKKLSEYYIKSNEQVLILIGPSGTGKTRLIRYLVKQLVNKIENEKRKLLPSLNFISDDEISLPSVRYTTDNKVMSDSKIFIDMLYKDSVALILEDIDFQLRDRRDGNDVMYKLLSSSDGFISNNNLSKIIVSTNIESESKIDSAFVRPGRCFGIIHTRELNYEESKNFLKIFNKDDIKLDVDRKYSIGELYRIVNNNLFMNKTPFKKIGF